MTNKPLSTSSAPSAAPLLSLAGEALFGPQWQAPLARALDVNLRRMQRWAAGEYEPPAGVWREIAELVKTKQRNNFHVIAMLSKKLRE